MPMPRAVARFNRVVTNRITGLFAGKLAPFAILHHHGRRSGREYSTPIMAFPCEGGFLIALTYGRGTDWERNFEAAGGGGLTWRGSRLPVGAPVPVAAARARRCLPWLVRSALTLGGIDGFLLLPAR